MLLLLFWVVRVCLPFSRRQRMKQALPLGKSHKSTDHMCRWPQWSSASHQTHEWPYPGGTQETQYRKPSLGAQRGPWPLRMAWWQPHWIHTYLNEEKKQRERWLFCEGQGKAGGRVQSSEKFSGEVLSELIPVVHFKLLHSVSNDHVQHVVFNSHLSEPQFKMNGSC